MRKSRCHALPGLAALLAFGCSAGIPTRPEPEPPGPPPDRFGSIFVRNERNNSRSAWVVTTPDTAVLLFPDQGIGAAVVRYDRGKPLGLSATCYLVIDGVVRCKGRQQDYPPQDSVARPPSAPYDPLLHAPDTLHVVGPFWVCSSPPFAHCTLYAPRIEAVLATGERSVQYPDFPEWFPAGEDPRKWSECLQGPDEPRPPPPAHRIATGLRAPALAEPR